MLETNRHEDVPKALEGRLLEEIRREVDGELRGVNLELTDQGGAIQSADQINQLFNLIVA